MSARATSWRTHTLDELRDLKAGAKVRLCGWSAGPLNDRDPDFELLDRFGACRVTVDPSQPALRKLARTIGREDTVSVTGAIKGPAPDRPDQLLIAATAIEIQGKAERVPFDPRGKAGAPAEAERLRYRHVDLKRTAMQERLAARSALSLAARNYLCGKDFIEVDAPTLGRWDDSAARTFVVPTAKYRAYGLVQTAQLYKQLLMLGGCDRVYQFSRCYRDEGAYGPLHQPEYTALDVEMSWASERDVYDTVNGMLGHMWSEALEEHLGDIPRLTFKDALTRYGSAAPDLRFDLALEDITDLCRRARSKPLQNLLAVDAVPGPTVQGMRVAAEDADAFGEDTYEALGALITELEGIRISWLRVVDTTRFEGPLAEGFDEHLAEDLCEALSADAGDLLILVLSPHYDAGLAVAGQVRARLGELLHLAPHGAHAFAWIHEIPFFAWSLPAHCFVRNRHLLTRPMSEDLEQLEEALAIYRVEEEKEQRRQEAQGFEDAAGAQFHRLIHDYGDPGLAPRLAVRSQGFELVLNGVEVGTGSIRNHDAESQRQVLELLSGSREEIPPAIAPLMAALDAGAPPHGGLAIGFDRLVAQALGAADVRDVIPFPKDALGRCPVSDAPGTIQPLHLQVLLGSGPAPAPSEPTDEHYRPELGGGASPATVEVAFAFEPNPPTVGQPVSFVDRTESVVPIVDRVWSCPKIKWRSTLPNPKKRFGAAGEYPITLTVFLADGRRASAKATVLVSRPRRGRGLR